MKKKTILIIDDEVLITELVREYLGMMGFSMLAANSAREGIEIARKEKPDLILLDVLMPHMSGVECLQVLRSENPDAMVVMVTAVHDERTAKQAIEFGAYDYITKPIDFDYLKNNILARVFPDFEL